MSNAGTRNIHKPIVIWLGIVYAMILSMVVIGGLTRLTGSGLSMVDWRPVMGVLPPMDDASWNAVFAQYQTSPEYQQVNHWMTVQDFKRIFFWEYLHRVLGRLLGVVFFIPWVVFWVRRQFPSGLAVRTSIAFVLGGLQGLMGWYMVQSGLVDVPEVSHLRLASHLLLAFLTAMWVLWLILDLTTSPRWVQGARERRVRHIGWGLVGLTVAQIFYGALMAGKHAGHVSHTFPTMNGEWIPSTLWHLASPVHDLFYHPVVIHFIHRSLGWALVVAILGAGIWMRRNPGGPREKLAFRLVIAAVVTQFLLGVATVVYAVPIGFAAVHQLGAFVLLSATVAFVHSVGRSA